MTDLIIVLFPFKYYVDTEKENKKKIHQKSFFWRIAGPNSVTVPKMLTFLKKSDIDLKYLVFNE